MAGAMYLAQLCGDFVRFSCSLIAPFCFLLSSLRMIVMMDSKFGEIKEAVGTVSLQRLQLSEAPGAPHTFSCATDPGRRSKWIISHWGACVSVFKCRLLRLLGELHCTFAYSMATDKGAPLGSTENPAKFREQDFKTLLQECLKSGELFADPAFPAEQKSIGMPEDPDPKKAIKWQRPKVPQRTPVFTTVTICMRILVIVVSGVGRR